jgi:K(+)-stimulated pyrophosphate-energized sodium pump
MSNAGGLWDNAKKLIESGEFGGPRSDAHKASVVGDTVGDPFKDTAGPSINTLITVMSLVSSLFAPIIAAFHLF